MMTFKSLFLKIYEIKINEILNYFLINFKILQAYFFSLRVSKNIFYLKKNFLSFSEVNSIAYTFYKIQNLNFTKFGNYGVSDLLDYKKYNLANFWHVSRLSVLIYSKYGCLVTLLGTFLFVFFHFIFISNISGLSDFLWILLIIFLFTCSTTVYGSCFACQNYSPLAYIFFPLFIFFTINHFYIISSLLLLIILLFSFSFFIISVLFIILLDNFSFINSFYLLLPSNVYLLYRFYFILNKNFFFNSILKIFRFTGFIKKNNRYKRRDISLNNKTSFYFLILYTLGILVFFIGNKKFPDFALIGLIIFVINQYLVRFSDFENVIIAYISLFAIDAIQHTDSFLSIFSFFIVSNPHPFFFRICSPKNFFHYNEIFKFKPINSFFLEKKISILFKNIKKKERIYFVFRSPFKNLRDNLFNGYQYIVDFPTYVANKNDLMIFPNSHTPFIYNKKTDINPWCNNPLNLKKKLLQFKCNYFLIFNDLSSSRLLSVYKNFTLINKFSFKDLKLNSDKYFYGKNVSMNQLELLLFKWKK
jgi:hypothetical protein